ncbi:Cryptochrome-2 [Podosphaera aphanis]|nr:Cryptochrome-2 [Podosphaera aphanis]
MKLSTKVVVDGPKRVLYWFRTDLRLHDSPALTAALQLNPEAFWPIWTWDPQYVYQTKVGVNRWQFLLDCQNEVSFKLTKINTKSKLFVLREAPQTLFPKLFKAWNITHLVFEKDTGAYERERDALVQKAAEAANVKVMVCSGRTLWDSDDLVSKNKNEPTMSISQVQTAGPKVGEIPRPLPAPTAIPDPGEITLEFEHEPPLPAPDLNSALRKSDDSSFKKISGPNGDFAVPTLEELGLPEATTMHRGGEHRALEMLDKIIANEKYTATFEKPNTSPTAFEPQSTTLLSPHLHFGSLGIREFYWRVREVVDKFKGKASQPPASLTGQLFFRDMYFGAHAALSHSFTQIVYNSHCRFIPWHLPSKIDHSTKRVTGEYHIDSKEAEEWFQRWKYGRTGFPWIDALMRQLRQEGWIHHLGRHAVACFLTRGGCFISWERGADVFREWLIDHETACNAGNWQWLSCSAFFTQFFRCYSPVAFPLKYDKNGDFVRRFVPELKALDKKYIYEPWKAPIVDRKKAGLTLEKDWSINTEGVYPMPMFDFNERRNICMDNMKLAFKARLYGTHPKVIDGTWKELFDSAKVAESDQRDVSKSLPPKRQREKDSEKSTEKSTKKKKT